MAVCVLICYYCRIILEVKHDLEGLEEVISDNSINTTEFKGHSHHRWKVTIRAGELLIIDFSFQKFPELFGEIFKICPKNKNCIII